MLTLPGRWWETFRYTTEGHRASIRVESDWGGPSDWQAVCSCGWAGMVFTNASLTPDTMEYGRPEDALRELLLHVGYNADEDTAATTKATLAGMKTIQALTAENRKAVKLHRDLTAILNGEPVDRHVTYLHRSASHSANVRISGGQDTAETYVANCSCGWRGTDFSPWNPANLDWLHDGSASDALRELLQHVEYDPNTEAVAVNDLTESTLTTISQIASDLAAARTRQQFLTATIKGQTP